MSLNLLDIILIVVVAFSVLVGFLRGFIREILSIICWVLAFWVAFRFNSFGESLFEQHLPEGLRSIVGFIVIFIVTLLIVSIASAILYRLFSATGITGTDRTLGGLFGFLRAVLIISVLVALVGITTLPRTDWWQQSSLIRYFVPISEMIIDVLPESIRGQLRGNLLETQPAGQQGAQGNSSSESTSGDATGTEPAQSTQ